MARESYAQTQIPARGRDSVPYPDWRSFIQGAFLRNAEAVAGTATGTGALLDVNLPFDPGYVWACKTAGTGAPVQAIKHPGLADDDCIKTVAAGTTTVDTAGLITLGSKKFTVGTDADLNENTQPIRYLALGFNDNSFQ